MGTACLYASELCQLLKAVTRQIKKLLAHYVCNHLVGGRFVELPGNKLFQLGNILLRKRQTTAAHKVFEFLAVEGERSRKCKVHVNQKILFSISKKGPIRRKIESSASTSGMRMFERIKPSGTDLK